MDITINAESAEVKPNNGRSVTVYLLDVEARDLIEEVEESYIVQFKDEEKLLDAIGKEKAMEYFGLVESE